MADIGLSAELSFAQLAWRRAQKKDLRDLFDQEFAEDEVKCFLGSGNCPFSATAIQAVLNDATPILDREQAGGESENGLLVWERPNPAAWYVLFVDPAGALFSSRCAMQMVNGPTGNQAAEWVGRTDAKTLAAVAADLMRRYGRVVTAVEVNLGEVSATVVAELRAAGFTTDGWPRLYQSQDSGGQWRLGWKTDGGNRPEMLDTLARLLRDAPHLFHSSRLANELKSCVRKGDRIEHGTGMTDDLVMAMAGAHKVRFAESEPSYQPWIEALSVNPAVRGGTDAEHTWSTI